MYCIMYCTYANEVQHPTVQPRVSREVCCTVQAFQSMTYPTSGLGCSGSRSAQRYSVE